MNKFPDRLSPDLPAAITALRESLDLTRGQFATFIGCHSQMPVRWETPDHCQHNPPNQFFYDKMRKLAQDGQLPADRPVFTHISNEDLITEFFNRGAKAHIINLAGYGPLIQLVDLDGDPLMLPEPEEAELPPTSEGNNHASSIDS